MEIWIEVTALSRIVGITRQNVLKRLPTFTTRRVGTRHEILLTSLPQAWQKAYYLAQEASATAPVVAPSSEALWQWYARRPQNIKAEAARRLVWMHRLDAIQDGAPITQVVREIAASDAAAPSLPTLLRWWAKVKDQPRADWLALLAPSYPGRQTSAECSPQAWDFFIGEYLSRRQTSAALCYERTQRAAEEHGWSLPSLKTMQRRIQQELSNGALTLARRGPEALRDTYSILHRDPRTFHAGEMVSGDGLKFDSLYVRWPDGEILNTTTAWFWQDGYSNKLLAYRVDKTENADLFRLAFYPP